MGSFSEIVMAFTLKQNIDNDVLRAFSGLRVRGPTEGARSKSASDPQLPLPAPHDAAINDMDFLVAYENGGYPDGFKPWMYDWSWLLSGGYPTVYFDVAPGASLAWTGHGWMVNFRTTAKTHAEELSYWFGWMGEFAVDSDPEHPRLIGYIKHEYEKRPWLVWHPGSGPFTFEDLNGPGDYLT